MARQRVTRKKYSPTHTTVVVEQCTCRPRQANYWKLRCPKHTSSRLAHALMPYRSYCAAGAKKDRVIHLLHRAEQHLPSYDRFFKDRLLKLAKERWPKRSILQKTSRKDLIKMLEDADAEEQKFERFMDLPPELRVRIYELHFQSFGAVRGPSQPPITKVSKLVRQESLPLFYQTIRLDLPFELGRSATQGDSVIHGPNFANFLRHVDHSHQSSIRNLRISYRMQNARAMQVWDVDVSTDCKSFKVEERTCRGFAQDIQEKQVARIDEILHRMTSRPGQRILRQEDILPLSVVALELWRDREGHQ